MIDGDGGINILGEGEITSLLAGAIKDSSGVPSYTAKVTTKCPSCGEDVSLKMQPDEEGRSLCISQWEEKDDECE